MKEFAIIVSIHLKPGKETVMNRILVLYYSTYGHIEAMAQAMAGVKRAEVS
jgi:hypothetical protein